MKYLSLLCLLCFLAPVQAEIYKSSDSEGQTVYSDQDLPNSVKMPTPTENVIQMPKLVIITPRTETEDGEAYVHLNIDKPIDDEILRNNQGNVSVSLSIKPALHTENGDYLVLYLDDEEVTPGAEFNTDGEADNQNNDPDTESDEDIFPDTIKTAFSLSNIDRGEHVIYAEVLNEDGDALITSNTVVFHMKRHSIQHNKAFGTTPGPQGIIFQPGPIILTPQ